MEEFKVRDLKKQEHIAPYVNDLEDYTPPKRKILLIDAVYGMTSRYFSFYAPRIRELYSPMQEGLVVKFDMYYEGFQVLFSVGPSKDGEVKNAKFKDFMDVRKEIDPEELRNTINMLRFDMILTKFKTNGYRTWTEFSLPRDKYSAKGFSYDYLELIFGYPREYEEEYSWFNEFLLEVFKNDLKRAYTEMQESGFSEYEDVEIRKLFDDMTPLEMKSLLSLLPDSDGAKAISKLGYNMSRQRKK